ncbi:hypothetical protein A1A1_09811 [Planococcus antarcticus DSM 14505]|uniref:Bacterial Ig-like domain-containing protein n=1 Tax=Planococcus antarcticus DSM 14505 TaxID=1185653 RepID=A0A1C7DH49_9BACL|nr:immunoglobulin-like domain-containing protein [Planococcus antarcticus]ANU10737.1 hypothetical protein BBH88_10680 [Planococcus antarcticus DSM 14505]EIM06832.1 hypothetical protein A1A1_09811 [Planococcus antarcticus DSM 14505]
MKKIIGLALIAVLFAACGVEPPMTTLTDPSPDQEMASSKSGLSLLLDEQIFAETPSVIVTTIKNDSMQDFGFGEYFHIEFKKDGEWYILTHSDAVFINNPNMTDFGNVLSAGQKTTMVFSIEKLGIVLVPGEYRLVKTFLTQEQAFFEISIASAFAVE